MKKLQYLAISVILSIFGLQIAILQANATESRNEYIIAQQKSNKNQKPETDDDMIKALQERDKKIEGFKDMLKIDGIVPEVDSEGENNTDTGDEMMDALQKRQNKIKNLKELKQAKDLLNQTKIKNLQKENINIENSEDIEKIQNIVNDKSLNEDEIIKALKKENINIDSVEKLQKIQKIINVSLPGTSTEAQEEEKLSPQIAFRMFAIGIPATILVFLVASPFAKGIISTITTNYDKKFGKPTVPERSLNLHHDAWKKISTIGRKVDRMNDDKFGNDEFKTLIHYKIDVAKNVEGFKELNYQVELLRAAMIAQKSFLKLESAELRYRGRKQQEFYRYVAENLDEDVDKAAFSKKIKKKQAELLPLINTEEGREALNSYTKELNEISKHELGLKLLAVFKKLELKDFSIIREISNIVDGLQGSELLEPKQLILTVKEYYDVFEKIAPILNISKEEASAGTYARILQIVGLVHRHGDSYQKFRELIRQLRKWEDPYETITTIREQYSDREYKLPLEFKQDILGESTHKQYEKYLPDLG